MKFEDQFKDDDAHDYVPKPKPPLEPNTVTGPPDDYSDQLRQAAAELFGSDQSEPKRYPPRTRQPGPPEGQDYFTLTAQYGRPRGFFEKDKPR